MAMPPAHRIARHNYPIRSAAFAYTLVVMVATWIEAGRVGVPEVLLAIGCFLVYPQLAYLYARVAVHSKRAELNNLYADCLLLGMWVAQNGR